LAITAGVAGQHADRLAGQRLELAAGQEARPLADGVIGHRGFGGGGPDRAPRQGETCQPDEDPSAANHAGHEPFSARDVPGAPGAARQLLVLSLRITTLEVSVLPPRNNGVGSQLTLLNGTLTVTVIAVPGVAVPGSGLTLIWLLGLLTGMLELVR
jgi:hypothetical protein